MASARVGLILIYVGLLAGPIALGQDKPQPDEAGEPVPGEIGKQSPEDPGPKAAEPDAQPDEVPSEVQEIKGRPDSPAKASTGPLFRLNQYVFDTTGTLSEDELDQIQLAVTRFSEETGFPMAVVMLDSFEETGSVHGEPGAVAEMLLRQFVKGRQDEGSGLAFLMLISLKERAIWIQKGTEWTEDVSESIQEITETTMMPLLKSGDKGGKKKFGRAIVAGISEMLRVLYRYQIVEKPIISESLDRFASRSWIWILLGLHLLGLAYVLCTKESEGWYLAGILFGLPILIAMLIFILQGEEDAGTAVGNRCWFLGRERSGEQGVSTWGYW